MVVIRLSRTGTKNSAFYHVVVTDSRNARDSGRYIERIGFYNPNARGQDVPLYLEKERVEYWTSKGAQLSDRVITLMKELAKAPQQPKAASAKANANAKKSASTSTAESNATGE